MSRMGPDLIELNGTFIQFVVACTLIDAFCGAIPLLWNLSASVKSNVLRLLTIFVVVFPLNIGRLELGFIAFAHGVPWSLAHECVSGLTYFSLLVFVITQHAWTIGPESIAASAVRNSAVGTPVPLQSACPLGSLGAKGSPHIRNWR
jgi:exosortase/archaeosortase